MSQKNDPQDASIIGEKGWRQGSTLPEDLLDTEPIKNFWEKELEITKPLGVIVSQDCDVVHRRFSTEPSVEILFGETITQVNRGFMGCRSPRQLHLEIDSPDNIPPVCVHFHINNRIRVDRKVLCDYSPNDSIKLSEENIEELRHLIALRYTRPAFPDAFGQRISTQRKQIEDLFKEKSSSLLSCLYLNLLPDTELTPDKTYNIIIAGCMREELYNDTIQKEQVEKLLKEFKKTMDQCEGIKVIGFSCDSEATLTLHDLRYLKRWSVYDYLTIREDSANDIPSSL